MRYSFSSNQGSGATANLEQLESRQLLTAYVVDTTADESDGDYSAGDLSLREAIELANADAAKDTITFSTVAFDGGGTITLGGTQLEITEDLVINGLAEGDIIISGDDVSRVFYIDSADVALSNFSITDGYVYTDFGGGVLVEGGALHLKNINVSDSLGGLGGGGIFVRNDVSLRLESSTLKSNTSYNKGASIGATGQSAEYADRGSTVTIIDSTIQDSTGDALWLSVDQATVVNSTIGENRGGGILINIESDLVIRNTTIAGNRGGIDEFGLGNATHGTRVIYNTIVGGNRTNHANDLGTDFHQAFNNIIADSSGNILDGVNGNVVGISGVGIRPIDEILYWLKDNGGETFTYSLREGSIALNAGGNDYVVSDFDQRGEPFRRIAYGAVDIGSVEAQSYVVDTLLDESDGDYSRGDLSLREAIELSNLDMVPNTITFDPSLIAGGATITLKGTELHITNDVTVSAIAGSEVVIDADELSRVLKIDDNGYDTVDVGLSYLKFTGGRTNFDGAGIWALGDINLELDHTTICDNGVAGLSGYSSVGGGGVAAEVRGDVLITNSLIENNFVTGNDLNAGRGGED